MVGMWIIMWIQGYLGRILLVQTRISKSFIKQYDVLMQVALIHVGTRRHCIETMDSRLSMDNKLH